MDDQIRREVSEFVGAMAKRHQEKLTAAGTFVALEDLTAQIGDEVARQLASLELGRRSEVLSSQPAHACPDCGEECAVEPDLEPIILQGMRGEIEYQEPRCHCSRCRRDFFPLAGRLGRPPRENVTPRILEKSVWAGTNLGSYPQASAAMRELVDVNLSTKCVQRMTSQIGEDRCCERALHVEAFRAKPLAERTAANRTANIPVLGVVMMDGGRHQRRDHFGQPRDSDRKTHWKENKVGLALSMQSEVFSRDPTPEFPEWLAGAKVVSEIAKLAERDEQTAENTGKKRTSRSFSDGECAVEDHDERTWAQAPKLLSREMIASTQEAGSFGWHLEYKAWQHGVSAAPRQAFVADGASVNWTIHRKHFSQMTGVLDLMHALSYAYRAAAVLDDSQAYRRFAEWIWQGAVGRVIRELKAHQKRLGLPEPDSGEADPRQRIHRALTYYTNHQSRMNYPHYRRQGLPLTSSHIESAIKQINLRVKGTEKFWRHDHAEAILQLRADSLSDSRPLKTFWIRWRANCTGTNHYRTTTI